MMKSRREDQFAARISLFPINLHLADVLERLAGSGRKPGKIKHRRSAHSRDPELAILGGGHVWISGRALVRQEAVGASEIRVVDRLLLSALPTSQSGGSEASDASRSTGNPQVVFDHADITAVDGCDSHQLAVLQATYSHPPKLHVEI